MSEQDDIDFGEALCRIIDAEREAKWKPSSALVWCDGSSMRVLAVTGGVFDCDDFECAIEPLMPGTPPPVGRGLWTWAGKAGWFGGTYESPHDVDLELVGEWMLATPDEAQGLGRFTPVNGAAG